MNIFRTRFLTGFSVTLALLATPPMVAADGDAPEREPLSKAQQEELLQEREAMMAAIEKSRLEVERNAEEARAKAELLRAEAEKLRAATADMARQGEEAREAARAELAHEREELSRTHRELRRASQEVARAHRELSLAEDRRVRSYSINLGDRAMMGVILGNQTDEGITIIGVSPDGPAERAGIKTGDILTSIRGEDLARGGDKSSREKVSEVMNDLGDGEEISIEVLRDDQLLDFMIKPEKREPTSWASHIRLPDPLVAPSHPDTPNSTQQVFIEKIAVPPVDTAVIAAEALALAEEMESFQFVIADGESDVTEYSYSIDIDPSDFEFDTEAFSQFGAMAMDEARLWFGSGSNMGLHFTSMNDGLADYFDTDSGVLVLEASEDNAFGLKPGDVVLKIGDSSINETSDFVRALRDHDSGDEIEMLIRRNKSDVTLDVVIPENRFGLLEDHFMGNSVHSTIAKKVIAD